MKKGWQKYYIASMLNLVKNLSYLKGFFYKRFKSIFNFLMVIENWIMYFQSVIGFSRPLRRILFRAYILRTAKNIALLLIPQ